MSRERSSKIRESDYKINPTTTTTTSTVAIVCQDKTTDYAQGKFDKTETCTFYSYYLGGKYCEAARKFATQFHRNTAQNCNLWRNRHNSRTRPANLPREFWMPHNGQFYWNGAEPERVCDVVRNCVSSCGLYQCSANRSGSPGDAVQEWNEAPDNCEDQPTRTRATTVIMLARCTQPEKLLASMVQHVSDYFYPL